MLDFNQIDKQKITTVLISDLHINPFEPAPNRLEQAFLAFLDSLIKLPNLRQFFILGDWFEAWLGDDVAKTDLMKDWLAPLIKKLQTLSKNGCQIYVMHGNRDFLMGQQFCDIVGAKLIFEPFYIEQHGKKIRLEHGDALCTDDKKYQRFRKVIQNPLTKKLLLALPMSKREQIAQNLREKSKNDNAKKSLQIMDVNKAAVAKALKNADILAHGHTHRPSEQPVGDKKRMVLGDWRANTNQVEAVVAVVVQGSMKLAKFQQIF